MTSSIKLTRNQLAKFLPDHEAIRQFEELLSVVDNISVSTGGGSGALAETFESVNQNIKTYPKTLTYTGSQLTSVTYTVGPDIITKTLYYSGSKLSTVTLSGTTPASISLTKTFTYSGDQLAAVTYS